MEDGYWQIHARWALGEMSNEAFADYLEERYADDEPPSPTAEILITRLRDLDEKK